MKYYSSPQILPVSPFWQSIQSLDSLGKMSIAVHPGSQGLVLFWLDIWHQGCTLSHVYPQLFSLCMSPHISLQEVVASQGTQVQFRRRLSGILLQEWAAILNIISSISFTHETDNIAWRWSESGLFTVKSLYQFLNFRGVQPTTTLLWWKLPVPPKIRAFMWLTNKNKILTKSNLHRRRWTGDLTCLFCMELEDSNHLFFSVLFC